MNNEEQIIRHKCEGSLMKELQEIAVKSNENDMTVISRPEDTLGGGSFLTLICC